MPTVSKPRPRSERQYEDDEVRPSRVRQKASLRRLHRSDGNTRLAHPFSDSVGAPYEPTLAPFEGSMPTRKLCAFVYVEPELRESIAEHFHARRHNAWAPCYGTDLVGLLRHAAAARRLVMGRDILLALLMVVAATMIGYVLAGGKSIGFIVVAMTVVAGAALRAILARCKITVRAICQQLRKYSRHSPKKARQRLTITFSAFILIAMFVVTNATARRCVYLIFGASILSWIIVVSASVASYLLSSKVLFSTGGVRRLARPLPEHIEKRARAVSCGNVLVYSRSRARGTLQTPQGLSQELGPFVGAGHRLTQWNTPIVDVARGRLIDGGDRVDPQPLDVRALHRELRRTAESFDLDSLQCSHRLYIDGQRLSGRPATHIPFPGRPPNVELPEADVLERIRAPRDYERGYLCLQATDRDGEVVVTMLVRAVLNGRLLQLEVSLHALPEVNLVQRPTTMLYQTEEERKQTEAKADVVERRTDVPRRPLSAVAKGITEGTRSYVHAVFGCLQNCAVAAVRPAMARYEYRRHLRSLRRGTPADFGADISLREFVALGQKMHYNAFVDMMGHVSRLQYRLVRTVADYLDSLSIDTAEFVGKSESIINNRIEAVFNNLTAGSLTFGNGNVAVGAVGVSVIPNGATAVQANLNASS